jgi:predicted lipid-binding transport protein (Tim44 family)
MMGDGFPFLDILLFALVAGFLILRLRKVLGQRTGFEKRRENPFGPPPAAEPSRDAHGREEGHEPARPSDNVISLPNLQRDPDDGPLPLGVALQRIKQADPQFNEQRFVEGARAAFEMIVTAFAGHDRATLQPLLAKDVFDRFNGVIEEREKRGETQTTKLVGIDGADIVQARLHDRVAHVTVRFDTDQVNVTRDRTGNVIDGDPDKTVRLTDVWTFARDTRSRDPNWLLVATDAGQ